MSSNIISENLTSSNYQSPSGKQSKAVTPMDDELNEVIDKFIDKY